MHACGGRIRVLYALAMTVKVGMVKVRSKAYYCRLMASTPAAVGLGATIIRSGAGVWLRSKRFVFHWLLHGVG